ncbi:c-type cytochrome biogenesis protein CcmI [Siculibacillus lacustris]|uniref:C-type cytochrome biogenesis protein CcmI n=1 Tax=Siculibacillus lacustris TaxID=1549641 RepID=A0A4Q9VX65_9HYPH|nr:c-type cytochrome biogenesis protein CcmI [Siculibacillus lacustris]TBW40970.1 c-type cytochrome biogenesis protein CcmI [Siculibacillus lacustris]
MLIWALFAAMTALAALIVLVPLARRGRAGVGAATESGDASVYRDQLAELDRDLAEGRVGDGEGEAARAEIARRLLRAARRSDMLGDPASAAARLRRRAVAAIAVIVLPLVAVGGYLALGRPDVPDRPLASRLAARPEGQSIDELVARVEAHLAAEPNDARGWDVLGPIYMRLNRPADAAEAFRTAIRLAGATELRQNGLGEALTAAADGDVGPEAKAAFEASLTVAPAGVLPRMYLALERAQAGRLDESAELWRRLIAAGTEADAWLPVARAELAKVEAAAREAAAPGAAPPSPAPTPAEVEAASRMTAAERAGMIEAMVARLDERLKRDGGGIDDWERLIRSQRTLGQRDAAAATLVRARAALAADPAAQTRLDALAAGDGEGKAP